MVEYNVSVLGGAFGSKVDVLAWCGERNLSFLSYLYGKCYALSSFIPRSFPCTDKCAVVIGSVGEVLESVAGAVTCVTIQRVRVAIWSCGFDCLGVCMQFGDGERPVKDVVPVEAFVCARCECGDELTVYYCPRAEEVRFGIGERPRRYLTAAHTRNQTVAVKAELAALVVVEIPFISCNVILHTSFTDGAVIVTVATAACYTRAHGKQHG